jgi:hypothetical protein
MDILPQELSDKIEADFPSLADNEKVQAKLLSLWSANLNVGAQLAKCILYLADGKLEVIDEIFESGFHGDPRDIIVLAMDRSDNKINWGLD